jgi:hypothetical protein
VGAGKSESSRPSAKEQEIIDLMKGRTLRSAKDITCPKSGQCLKMLRLMHNVGSSWFPLFSFSGPPLAAQAVVKAIADLDLEKLGEARVDCRSFPLLLLSFHVPV